MALRTRADCRTLEGSLGEQRPIELRIFLLLPAGQPRELESWLRRSSRSWLQVPPEPLMQG